MPAPVIAPYAPTTVEIHAVEASKPSVRAMQRKPGEAVDILTANPAEVFLRDVLEDWAKHGKAGRQSYALPTAKNAGADAAYWVPLLGLYTGARITELCQLRIDDFSEKEGYWMLRLAVTDEAQSLKAAASWREIPLPAELLELGLLQYRADRRKRQGSTDAFHIVGKSRKQQMAKNPMTKTTAAAGTEHH